MRIPPTAAHFPSFSRHSRQPRLLCIPAVVGYAVIRSALQDVSRVGIHCHTSLAVGPLQHCPALNTAQPSTHPALNTAQPSTHPALNTAQPSTHPALNTAQPSTLPSPQHILPSTHPALNTAQPSTQRSELPRNRETSYSRVRRNSAVKQGLECSAVAATTKMVLHSSHSHVTLNHSSHNYASCL